MDVGLSEDMYDAGFKNITNVDFSKVCVKSMQEKYIDRGATFKYIAMDISEMEFGDSEFNVVIDKATLDSVLVSIHPICFKIFSL